eukprot:4376226-Prymnesium_polylepis.2
MARTWVESTAVQPRARPRPELHVAAPLLGTRLNGVCAFVATGRVRHGAPHALHRTRGSPRARQARRARVARRARALA